MVFFFLSVQVLGEILISSWPGYSSSKVTALPDLKAAYPLRHHDMAILPAGPFLRLSRRIIMSWSSLIGPPFLSRARWSECSLFFWTHRTLPSSFPPIILCTSFLHLPQASSFMEFPPFFSDTRFRPRHWAVNFTTWRHVSSFVVLLLPFFFLLLPISRSLARVLVILLIQLFRHPLFTCLPFEDPLPLRPVSSPVTFLL